MDYILRVSIVSLFSLISIANLGNVNSAKILSVAFMSSKSHKITYEPLLYELAKRGHQITIVTPVDSKKIVKNVREIVTIDFETIFNDMPNMFEMKERNEHLNLFGMVDIFEKMCRDTYDLPKVRNLMNEKFDAIIMQPLFNDCVMGYVHRFNTTIILVIPFGAPPMYTWLTGGPSPPSFIPNFFLPYTQKMTYYQRMVNFGITLAMTGIQDWYFKPAMEAIYREKLEDPNIPSVNDILRNVSFILSNAHFSLSGPKPYLPDVVDVGGMHCRPAQPLPKDLDEFLNSSGDEGFIYFSMGSAIKAHTMPEKYRKIFINTFAKLKQKVLWKWEVEEMADLPKNVKIGKWLPQQDILGHPKIKMFITHGGYGGITEAVYHGVPLLGIPIFGDQQLNMEQSEKSGFALILDFNQLSEENFLEAINRILNEKTFNEQVKHLSNILRDQPDKPLDRAVFWTEYIIRHKGAVHMRSAARDLNFIQYHSLDVIGSYAAIILTILYLIFAILRFLFRLICGSSAKDVAPISRKKKKN